MPTNDDTIPMPNLEAAKNTPPTPSTPSVGKPIPASKPTKHKFFFSAANMAGKMINCEILAEGETRALAEPEAKRLFKLELEKSSSVEEAAPTSEDK